MMPLLILLVKHELRELGHLRANRCMALSFPLRPYHHYKHEKLISSSPSYWWQYHKVPFPGVFESGQPQVRLLKD